MSLHIRFGIKQGARKEREAIMRKARQIQRIESDPWKQLPALVAWLKARRKRPRRIWGNP